VRSSVVNRAYFKGNVRKRCFPIKFTGGFFAERSPSDFTEQSHAIDLASNSAASAQLARGTDIISKSSGKKAGTVFAASGKEAFILLYSVGPLQNCAAGSNFGVGQLRLSNVWDHEGDGNDLHAIGADGAVIGVVPAIPSWFPVLDRETGKEPR
jgi:hypothetical protein